VHLDAETDVIQRRDGSLLAALRSSKVDLHFADSLDGGKTWGPVRSAGWKGHSPHFLRHSTGTIILSHRLPKTALHWSRDDGQTWQGPLQVDDVIGAYPSCVELRDGRVLCVYYEEGPGSGIRATRLLVGRDGVTIAP
jgi:sialidase-1